LLFSLPFSEFSLISDFVITEDLISFAGEERAMNANDHTERLSHFLVFDSWASLSTRFQESERERERRPQ
jgi:hypothetical protein